MKPGLQTLIGLGKNLTSSLELPSVYSINLPCDLRTEPSCPSATSLLLIMGGKVSDLEKFLVEERIPENWEPTPRQRFGIPMAQFNKTVKVINAGIDEEKVAKELKSPSV